MCVVPSKLNHCVELHISLLSLMVILDTHGPTYKKKWLFKYCNEFKNMVENKIENEGDT